MLSVNQKMSMMIGEYMGVSKPSQNLCKTYRKKEYICNIITLEKPPFYTYRGAPGVLSSASPLLGLMQNNYLSAQS
jgi:hypothetical protein